MILIPLKKSLCYLFVAYYGLMMSSFYTFIQDEFLPASIVSTCFSFPYLVTIYLNEELYDIMIFIHYIALIARVHLV